MKDWKFFVPNPWYNESTWRVDIASQRTSEIFLFKRSKRLPTPIYVITTNGQACQQNETTEVAEDQMMTLLPFYQ